MNIIRQSLGWYWRQARCGLLGHDRRPFGVGSRCTRCRAIWPPSVGQLMARNHLKCLDADEPKPVTGLAAKYDLPRRVGGKDNFLELTDYDLEKWAKEIEADERMRAMG